MINSLAHLFLKNADKNKFIFEIETGKKISHEDLASDALNFSYSNLIKNKGIISIILPNSIDYIECFLGCMLKGAVFSPLPYFTQVQELKKIFEYVDPSLIITNREDVKSVFTKKYKVISLSSLKSKSIDKKKYNIKSSDPLALYYSSGTTGNPKGVLYSQKNIFCLIKSIVKGFKFSKNDRQLALLPFGHTASINYNILPSLFTGCDLYVSKGFEHLRNNFFSTLSKHKITFTEIVPTILLWLNKIDFELTGLDLSNLSFIGCGSSTLPLESQKIFTEKYNIKIGNLYGLSETGPTHIDDPREKNWTMGSLGYPLDVNECKINNDGEILIKGDNVFIGYYKNESLYKKIVINGWFYTGDLGEIKDTKYYFTDRKKDLIIKSGINIVPMEIEEIIYQHDEILECVVVGLKDKFQGEEIVAVCVKSSLKNDELLKLEILKLCRSKLSLYKIPKQIFFWKEIPKTASHKLLRKDVRLKINS